MVLPNMDLPKWPSGPMFGDIPGWMAAWADRNPPWLPSARIWAWCRPLTLTPSTPSAPPSPNASAGTLSERERPTRLPRCGGRTRAALLAVFPAAGKTGRLPPATRGGCARNAGRSSPRSREPFSNAARRSSRPGSASSRACATTPPHRPHRRGVRDHAQDRLRVSSTRTAGGFLCRTARAAQAKAFSGAAASSPRSAAARTGSC